MKTWWFKVTTSRPSFAWRISHPMFHMVFPQNFTRIFPCVQWVSPWCSNFFHVSPWVSSLQQPSEPLLRHQGGAAEAHGAAQHRGGGVDVALDLETLGRFVGKAGFSNGKKNGKVTKKPPITNNSGWIMDTKSGWIMKNCQLVGKSPIVDEEWTIKSRWVWGWCNSGSGWVAAPNISTKKRSIWFSRANPPKR